MPPLRPTPDQLSVPRVDLKELADFNRRSVHAMAEMNRRMFHAMLTVQSEVLSFTQRRLAEDVATMRTLAACDEKEEAIRIVQDFQARAIEDFSREASELVRLGAEVTTSIVREAEAEFTPRLDD